ncbi:hypothetical protein COF80_00075 [Bacillus toyonensis]|nr:hypothetical protein COF80_00075 [Bacillus toyonensis]
MGVYTATSYLTFSVSSNFYIINLNGYFQRILFEGGIMIMITNIEQSTINYMIWYATHYLHANPNTFYNVGLYPYEIHNLSIVPKFNRITVNPSQKDTVIQTIENNTDVEQHRIIEFYEKTTENITNCTTAGYSIYEGIKSTFTCNIQINFLISGGLEESLEVPVHSEYKCHDTETTNTTYSKLWQVKQTVIIPPHSRINANLIIMGTNIKIPMQLSANIKGTHVHNNKSNYFSSLSFQQHDGSKVRAKFCASNLSQDAWPDKPVSFRSPGPYSSLNLKGDATTTIEPGLYAMVRFEKIPLNGNYQESKIWYSDQVLLRDGREIRLPNFDPLTGKASCIDVDMMMIGN